MKRAAVLAGLGGISLVGYLVAATPAFSVAPSTTLPNVHAAPVVYRVHLSDAGRPVGIPRSGALVAQKAVTSLSNARALARVAALPVFVPGRVLRVLTKTAVRPIAYRIQRVPSSHLYIGSTRVLQYGRDGAYRLYFHVVERGSRIVATELVKRTLVARARPEIVAYGTLPPPPPPPTVGPHGTRIPGWIAALNWHALAMCESGGNPRAIGWGVYGLYQFELSTWYSVGGVGNPVDASIAEQTYRAELLYLRSGASPWACGYTLSS